MKWRDLTRFVFPVFAGKPRNAPAEVQPPIVGNRQDTADLCATELPGRFGAVHWTESEAIVHAVRTSGLVSCTPESLAFYETAGPEFRKQSTLLDNEKLKALGLRTNIKLSLEFMATLNTHGLIDPVESANSIRRVITTSLGSLRSLVNMAGAGVLLAKFNSSVTAVGPCDAAAALSHKGIPINDAPLLPLALCDRPNQCGCMYSATLR